MRGALIGAALVVGALLACKSKHTGTVTVDGAAFEITECRSGQANSPPFEGVDFLDASRRRVRFLRMETGQVRAFLFAPGQLTGEMIGEGCGTMSVQQQNSEVNGIKNVNGSVAANCAAGGHSVVAGINFENCH
jgi:hypothetical protein